jgi:hypothetical protein
MAVLNSCFESMILNLPDGVSPETFEIEFTENEKKQIFLGTQHSREEF